MSLGSASGGRVSIQGGSASRGGRSSSRGYAFGGLHQGICIRGNTHLEVVCPTLPSPTPTDTQDTTEYGQQVVGTHPTGMFSFVTFCSLLI